MTMFMCGNAVSAMRAFTAAAAFLLFLPACMKTEEPVSVQDDGLNWHSPKTVLLMIRRICHQ